MYCVVLVICFGEATCRRAVFLTEGFDHHVMSDISLCATDLIITLYHQTLCEGFDHDVVRLCVMDLIVTLCQMCEGFDHHFMSSDSV